MNGSGSGAEISEQGVGLPPIEELGRGHRSSVQGSPISPPQKTSRLPSLQRRTSLLTYEPIVVTFVKNGDLFFEGVKMNIKQRNMRSWGNLLSELSIKMDLPAGVRHIYTPGGRRVKSLRQLEHKKTYVCGSLEPFKKIDYRNIKNPEWKMSSRLRVSEAETQSGFFTLSSPSDPHQGFSRSLGDLYASARSWMEASSDGGRKRSRKHSQKPKIMHLMSIAESELRMKSREHLRHSEMSLPSTTGNPRHLALSIYRNGPHQNRECVKVYMDRNTIKSWEEAKKLISENLRMLNGYLHLYKLVVEEVESLSQLWAAGTNLIAAEEDEFCLSDILMGSRGMQVNCTVVVTHENACPHKCT